MLVYIEGECNYLYNFMGLLETSSLKVEIFEGVPENSKLRFNIHLIHVAPPNKQETHRGRKFLFPSVIDVGKTDQCYKLCTRML